MATAVTDYARATPDIEHHILFRLREATYRASGELDYFSTHQALPQSPVGVRSMIRSTVRDLNPDFLHAHSSFAGAYARTAVLSRDSCPIIYTPHGFAFERRDIGRFLRGVYRAVEVVLALNTAHIAACAPREHRIAQQFHGSRSRYVPNVARINKGGATKRRPGDPLRVVAAGRLAPARDPAFFATVATACRTSGLEMEFVWVGGGDDELTAMLESAGVQVTGWLSREEGLAEMASGHVYVHTAAWDGFPMSILEAHALGMTVIARRSAALEDAPSEMAFDSHSSVVSALARIERREQDYESKVRAATDLYLIDNSASIQTDRLVSLYGAREEYDAPTV